MIRFGIIGTNATTENFLNGAMNVDEFSLAAVYSRTEEKAKEFANKHTRKFKNCDRNYGRGKKAIRSCLSR